MLAEQVRQTIADVQEKKKYKGKLDISVGTMIEIPRACLDGRRNRRRGRLLQLRHERPDADDVRLQPRRHQHVPAGLPEAGNPARAIRSRSLDTTGVGQLVDMAVKKGRAAKKGLKCGICGEHGGDPDSIVFCHKVGLDYVSCSPFRVPIARLAAAQAALKQSGTDSGRKGE